MSFDPFEPTSGDSALDWAQKVHRAAFTQRKINYSPGVLISHTTQGVFVKPKPCDECSTNPTDMFQIKWRLPLGGSSDAVELFDLINAEPIENTYFDIGYPYTGATRIIGGYIWVASLARLKLDFGPGRKMTDVQVAQSIYVTDPQLQEAGVDPNDPFYEDGLLEAAIGPIPTESVSYGRLISYLRSVAKTKPDNSFRPYSDIISSEPSAVKPIFGLSMNHNFQGFIGDHQDYENPPNETLAGELEDSVIARGLANQIGVVLTIKGRIVAA